MSGEQQRTMSGLAFVQGLLDGALPLNSMAETLGYDIVEASAGRAYRYRRRPLDRHRGRILAHGTTTCPIYEY